MALSLTVRQAEVLAFIRDYTAESGGVSPSYAEMREALGVASNTSLQGCIAALIERGHLRRLRHRARSLSVVNASPDPKRLTTVDALIMVGGITRRYPDRAGA